MADSAAASVLRRIMAKLREDSGSLDPMEPFSFDASWEKLARQADAVLAAPPDGFAVVTLEGSFVGTRKTRETAELVKNRGSVKNEIVRPIVFADSK